MSPREIRIQALKLELDINQTAISDKSLSEEEKLDASRKAGRNRRELRKLKSQKDEQR